MEASSLLQCIVIEKQPIKFTYYDEAKKRAHDPQIVRAKANVKLGHA